jgi:hypothetical protein
MARRLTVHIVVAKGGERMSKIWHTPGPWRVANNSRSVLAGPIKINQQAGPAAQSAAVEARNEFTLRANAKLIAAAPELLAALQRLTNVHPEDLPYCPDEWQAAMDAIKKTTGDQ